MVEDTSLRVSTSLKQRCKSLLLVLELLPHSNYIVAWVIFLSLLKKLYPQFSSLHSLNCESCQYAKLHRVHLSLRVNNRASAPFELVHSYVWDPCPVVFPTGFRYFVTFVDDYSRTTWLYLMKNRTELFSHFRAFSKVPKHYWANVVSTTSFLINRIPFSVLNWVIPFQTLFPHKSLFPLEPQVFGCTCFVRDVCPHVSKLDPKSLKCIFLGYSRVQKGYRCYCPSLRRYQVSVNVTFLENTSFP